MTMNWLDIGKEHLRAKINIGSYVDGILPLLKMKFPAKHHDATDRLVHTDVHYEDLQI